MKTQASVPVKEKKKRMKPLRFIQKYGRLLMGGTIIAAVLLCAIFAPVLATHDPYEQNMQNAKALPSAEHIMGTDYFGRDIWSRLVIGSQNTLLVTFITQIVVTVVGTVIGLFCGYFPKVEKYVMRFLDAYATIPGLLMNMMMLAAFGSSIFTLVLAMSLNNIPALSRSMRNQVLFVRNKEYIESAKAMGASDVRTMFVHVLPNISNYLWVRIGGALGGTIGSMTSLSYLGLGLDPTIPSWGGMVQDGQTLMFAYPHLSFFAIGAISLTVFGFVMLGDGLRDLLDPRLN